MTENVKKSLKDRVKLTKYYYWNCQKKEDHEKRRRRSWSAKANTCTKEMPEAKTEYILRMTDKLSNPTATPKT